MQDAVVLARALEVAPDVDTALTLFGEARYDVCKFVQDVSRAVGEAGAQETPGDDMAARNNRLRATAQSAVDGFYSKLDALDRAAETQL